MKPIYKLAGFVPYVLIVFLNSTVDLGHKIILQNTVFKAYNGAELIIYTAVINALILLPFIFLFSPAGFISDKYDKTKVVQVASLLAIVITSFITLSYYQGWFELAFALTLVLAAQSAIYSPAKYGLIKTLFGIRHITNANGITQAITIVSILLGALIYSYFFEMLLADKSIQPDEILRFIAPIGFVLIGSSVIEFLLSFKLPTSNNANTKERFSVKKYLTLGYLKQDRLIVKSNHTIRHSIIGLSIFWAMSQVVAAVFGEFLKSSLGITNAITAQAMLAIGGLGIVFGSLISGRISKRYIETGLIPIGAIGIASMLLIIPNMGSLSSISIVFFSYGLFAGLMIVPLNAMIQFSAPNAKLGKILAANNFYQSVAMFLALMLTAYASYIGLASSHILTITAIVAMLGALFTLYKLPQSLVRYFVKFFLSLKYKIKVDGLENIPNGKGILLLGNHISYLDWAVLQTAYPRQIRFVMEKTIYKKWYWKWFLDFFKVIPISKTASKNALKAVTKALNQGHAVALFPEGYLSRNGQINQFLKGYEIAIADTKNTVIVPFYLHGLWQSRFSLAADNIQAKAGEISVRFGKGLEHTTKTAVLKEKVIDLSLDAWDDDIQSCKSISRVWLCRIKREKSFFVADSSGIHLNNYKFLAGTLMMRTWLKKKLKNQQNIGLILPSLSPGAMANMALLVLGKTLVNLNYTSGSAPLSAAIEQAEIKSIITSKQFIQKLAQKGFDLSTTLLKAKNIIYLEDMRAYAHKFRALSYYLRALLYPVWLLELLFAGKQNINDTAVILFSSGSEGSPKGVKLSHKNLIANVKQAKQMLNPLQNDVLVSSLPIFHSFGLSICTLMPQLEGISVIYHADPTDGYGIGKLVAQHRGTVLFSTATFLKLYIKNKKCQPLMFDTLNMVVAGAEKLPNDVGKAFKQKFGVDVFEGYGATETAPAASCNVPDQLIPDYWKLQVGNKIGTIGRPLSGTKIIITDPNTFEPLPIGEAGMIMISGVQVMQGYLNNPEKTDEVLKTIDKRRYYVTGDKGKIDQDGFISIIDRYSRFAKIGAEMVSLGAVESFIKTIIGDEIDICAITTIDDKKGEKIVLLYQTEIEISPAEFKKQLINAKMNPVHIPSKYLAVAALPKLGSGKTDFNGAKILAKKILAQASKSRIAVD